MSSVVVGLDLSLTSTGWASIAADGTLRWGVIAPPGPRRPIGERLDVLRREVATLTAGAELVVIEGPVVRSSAAVALGRVHGVVEHALWSLGTRMVIAPPATVKMLATGRGNAAKPDVRGAARQRLGYAGESDDEADAVWLADLGARLLGWPRSPLPQAHLRSLDKLVLSAA